MVTDLSFLKSEKHKKILEEISQSLREDNEIIGMMLNGSHARGDANIDSDLDLLILLKEDHNRTFEAKFIYKILVEYKYLDINKARARLQSNHMEPYQYLEGKILFDDLGSLNTLKDEALIIYNSYQLDKNEKKAIYHWLFASRIKIEAAIKSQDYLKAIFVTSTSSYKIMEGIWGVCNKPIPPAGSVLSHLDDLKNDIPFITDWTETLFLGTIEERIHKAIEMIEWINQRIMND